MPRPRAWAGSAARSCGATALIAALVFGCLIGLSVAAAQVDRSHYRGRVQAAVSDGTFAARAFTPFAPGLSSRFHYNDCLIASMLVLEPGEGALRSAVSPLVPLRVPAAAPNASVPQAPMCGNMIAALADPAHPSTYYHRYLHGDWVLASLLLYALPWGTASSLLFGLLVSLPLLTAGLAGRRLVAGGPDPARARAFLAMSAAFLLLGGHGLYGRSFSFAPSDIVLGGFLLWTWLRPPAAEPMQRIVSAAALFGALTAAFEFLIGAAPAAIALIAASFAFSPGVGRRHLRPLAVSIAAFAGAFLLMFAMKLALVAALWGLPEVEAAGSQLLHRVGGEHRGVGDNVAGALAALGIDADWLTSTRLGVVALGASKMLYHARFFEYGSPILGFAIIGAMPAGLFGFSAYRLWRERDGERRLRAALMFGATVSIFAWYLLFANHTAGHAPFMMRPLSWLAILLCGYLAWLKGVEARAGIEPACKDLQSSA